MSYEPGARIGKYEIRRKLGQGAMGEVYVAYDPLLERHAALKVMATSALEQSDLKTRFEREAKAVARLQHPNIVTVYDFGYDDGSHSSTSSDVSGGTSHSPSGTQAAYIVMELLKGTDLEQSLKFAPPPVSQSLRIVLQVCRGLAHAHDNGIVHRDVKPANIFVTDGGLVKIMDFGIARWTQVSQTKTGTVIGTAAFMSPEQLLGHRVDGRSDLFSLGVILYQLLSHQQPFAGEDVGQIFYRILNTQPPRLLLEGEQIPGIQRILDRALAKELEDRYSSAHEMAQELEELIPDLGETLVGRTTMSIAPPDSTMAVTPSPASDPGPTVIEGPSPAVDPGPTVTEGPSPEVRGRSGVRWEALALAAAVVVAGGLYYFAGDRRGTAPPVEPPAPAVAEVSSSGPGTVAGGITVGRTAVRPYDEPSAAASDPTLGEPEPEPVPLVNGGAVQTAPPPAVASAPPPAAASPPPAAVTPPPPPVVSTTERAAAEAAAARAALDRGELEEASRAISRGRQLDPSQAVWRDLSGRLETLRAEREERQLTRQRADRFLEEALAHLEADELDQAIAAFRKVLVFDPENVQAANGLRQVESLQRKLAPPPSAPRRSFSESATEMISAARSQRLEGFSAGGEVAVEKGSADLSVPGEVLIELNPPDAKAAEPYTLTVRLHNETNAGLVVKSLELVTSYGGKKLGEGVEIPMKLRRVGARSTAVLHQVPGQWKEEQNAGGSITATVTLVKGKLKKVLTWSAGS